MSHEDTSARIMAWQAVRDRIPEGLRATVDHIVRRQPFPNRKTWKEIDNVLADTVAKASGSVSSLDIATENPLLEQMNVRSNYTNNNNTSQQNSNTGYKGYSSTKPSYADAAKSDKKPEERKFIRNDQRPFPSRDDKTTWRFPDRENFCYFHQRFGPQATKCREPCRWDPNYRPEGLRNNNAPPNTKPAQTTSAPAGEVTKKDNKPLDA